MVFKAEDGILEERKASIMCSSKNLTGAFKCDRDSVAGSVSQRACVYCGARVVLNPITDAFHIVHGPIGCASYTWDIRGSLSSGPEIYRNSFSTDLREEDVIFGGEKKLTAAIDEICEKFSPKVIFVYATCIVGVIGDDIEAVCKKAAQKHGIRVIPVQSSGFAGNKSMGYKAACKALLRLMNAPEQGQGQSHTQIERGQSRIQKEAGQPYTQTEKERGQSRTRTELTGKEEGQSHNQKEGGQSRVRTAPVVGKSVNILGDFNLAGEMWIIQSYLEKIGVKVLARITGDARSEEITHAPEAALNIVQCAGSMTFLAREMEELFGTPFVKISFFGLEDIRTSIMNIAETVGDRETVRKAKELIKEKEAQVSGQLEEYRRRLKGRSAAIYVGGGFKAISLIRQFADLGVRTVMVGTQTGRPEEYEIIRSIAEEDTVILDDTNPAELERFIKEKGADILVGGVKERPLAYKLGIAFCDHNHERKHPLCGFEGAVNFAREIDLSVNSPVWKYVNVRRQPPTYSY